ncbi:MAG TPA: imidazole glycerol phosphate synthase subunit HisH [Bryobacteraceae bacterium]
MIQIINYQAGNLRSVKKAFDFLGLESEITADPDQVAKADKLVLPGVGHFSSCEVLARTGLRDAIQDAVKRGTPFLGICVGMQWAFQSSEEAPQTPGLGLFAGACGKFPAGVKVPHVGWNSLDILKPSRLLSGIESGAFVYFTHSYRAPMVEETVASTDYEGAFSSAVERENVFGVQFHPEKSASAGLKMLQNFGAMKC